MAAIEQAIQVGSFIFESTQDNLVAGGSNAATALNLASLGAGGAELNRFTTVAAGAGAMLPAAKAGLTVMIINHGANNLQVYGNGGDTINDIAGSTGVAQMPNSAAMYICTSAGAWYSLDLATGYYNASGLASLPTYSTQQGIVAHSGGGSAGAVQLAASLCMVTSCATASASVLLPPSEQGAELTLVNNGGNSVEIFPAGTDTINGAGAGAGINVASNTVTLLFCVSSGAWWSK